MKAKRTLILLIIAVLTGITMLSCSEQQMKESKADQADSLINSAYKSHDYNRLLELSDLLQSSGELSDMQANYWRGYAYSRQRKMRLAENNWRKATELEIKTEEDRTYYSKSANRLAGVLLLKGEYEETMKLAIPAMQIMTEAGMAQNCDYAYLLITVGCCQSQLGSPNEATGNFEKALQTYLGVIANDADIAHFKSAIVGVITITDNYLFRKQFKEAYEWTGHFDELLNQCRQLSNPDEAFLDKQKARLNFYQACALEGLGNKKGAAESYDEALKTNYAKTNEGKLEATSYLMSAGRWNEAARNFEILDEQITKFNITLSLENIQRYLLPKYNANIGAHKNEEALAVGTRICNELDSAIARMKQDEAMELSIMYNTQQKETEIVHQKANLARQRFLATVMVLVLVILCFVLIIYFRHQSAMRLSMAYYQLEIANEHTKESSRMKTSFIQQISHEIRTPLNILSGFTQVITTPGMELDETTKQDINQKILENTNRITELVNKMLELSDVNSKAVIERNDQVLAIQIAAESMNGFVDNAKYPIPIDLQMGEGADGITLFTNEKAATRALELLLDNAEKYTKEGTIRLIVDKTDEMACFTVEDTGIGIPPEEAEHIFEEFVQLNEYEEGTGIGLTVARSISRRLGGDVILDTSYAGGARFVMTLPLGEETAV